MKKKHLIVIFSLISILIISAVLFIGREGAGREIGAPLDQGNIEVPVLRSFTFHDSSAMQQEIIEYWTTIKPTEWTDGEKIDLKNSRTVLGCLTAGVRIEEMNQYLMRQKATGVTGSRWLLNPRGGYNFNTMAFTPVLYLFDDRPDLLYPKTKAHLVKNILTIEGAEFTRNVPKLPMQDSENHILMAESSRYLKNQWLRENGELAAEFNNETNGVGEGLKSFLEEIYQYGLYEFNSDPYLGYSLSALLNLEAFAEGDVKILARKILDRLNWQYALGSYQFNHFPPYRRRFKDAYRTGIDVDYHTAMMKVWMSFFADSLNLKLERGAHHGLWASLLPYRPTDKVVEWTLRKPSQYFVKLGHGYNSCPEIYSGDVSYLLSAGGANQGRNSLIMPKPIVLFLDDDALELEGTFHMYGPGEALMEWNNTGVYQDFACAKGMVHIPYGKQMVHLYNGWQVTRISEGIFLNIYAEQELGLMVTARANSAEESLKTILQHNPDKLLYHTQFNHPNGNLIEYDLDAPKDTWVIHKFNGEKVDRKFDQWPFFDGDIDMPD